MRKLVKKLPYIRRLHLEIGHLKTELERWRTWKPPGHFYSPIPSLGEIRNDDARIFERAQTDVPAVDLNKSRQLELLNQFHHFYQEMPFPENPTEGFRYHFNNNYFSYADGIALYCMMRQIQPQRVIEVGSGFSSALMLDTNDRFFDQSVEFTFIEPYPERLESLISKKDEKNVRILRQRVQEVSLSLFKELQPGDFLFIDSSHVSKTGSDVNFLLFNILPMLKPGVYVHFHDVFFPFEYPKNWIYSGVAWNEVYMLRAFLQYNHAFQIEYFVSFMTQELKDEVYEATPKALKSEKEDISLAEDAPGGSIWLLKKGSNFS